MGGPCGRALCMLSFVSHPQIHPHPLTAWHHSWSPCGPTLHQLPFGMYVCVNCQAYRIALQGLITGRPNLWTVFFRVCGNNRSRSSCLSHSPGFGAPNSFLAIWKGREYSAFFISMIKESFVFCFLVFCKTLITRFSRMHLFIFNF